MLCMTGYQDFGIAHGKAWRLGRFICMQMSMIDVNYRERKAMFQGSLRNSQAFRLVACTVSSVLNSERERECESLQRGR